MNEQETPTVSKRPRCVSAGNKMQSGSRHWRMKERDSKKCLKSPPQGKQVARVKEADAATLLQSEQNKWQDLSDQLSALTQSLDLVPLYRHLKTRKPHSGTALSFPPPFCLDPDGKKPCCLSCPEAITGDALNSLRKLVEPRARLRHVSDGAGSNVDRKNE